MVLVLKYSCCRSLPHLRLAISARVGGIQTPADRCGQKCRLGSMYRMQRILCTFQEVKAMSSQKQKADILHSSSPLSPAQPRGTGWEKLGPYRRWNPAGGPGHDTSVLDTTHTPAHSPCCSAAALVLRLLHLVREELHVYLLPKAPPSAILGCRCCANLVPYKW